MKEGVSCLCCCVVCVHSVARVLSFFYMWDREESTQGIPQRDANAPNKERGFQICEWREEKVKREEEKQQVKSKKEGSTWYLGHSHTDKYFLAFA